MYTKKKTPKQSRGKEENEKKKVRTEPAPWPVPCQCIVSMKEDVTADREGATASGGVGISMPLAEEKEHTKAMRQRLVPAV